MRTVQAPGEDGFKLALIRVAEKMGGVMFRSFTHDEIIVNGHIAATATSPWEVARPTPPFAAAQCGGSLYGKLQNFVHTITVAARNDAAGAGRTLLDLRQSGRKSTHEGSLLRYCSGANKFD